MMIDSDECIHNISRLEMNRMNTDEEIAGINLGAKWKWEGEKLNKLAMKSSKNKKTQNVWIIVI